jgi:prepilin-type N-terminal cleavage/methylation domain-containing protein
VSTRRRQFVHGLTLLEVIIAIALIAMLLSALLTFFWQTLKLRDQAAGNADRTQLVQQILTRMSEELRNALPLEKTGFPLQTFSGDRRRVTFLASPMPALDTYTFYRESELTGRSAPQADLREITYELWIDPEKTGEGGEPIVGGILRTERRAVNPSVREELLADEADDLYYVRHELWAHELGYLEFRYFDGVEWAAQWEVAEGNPLPHLVQISVGFNSLTRDQLDNQDLERINRDEYPLATNLENPEVPNADYYTTIVRIAAADVTFASHMNRMAGDAEEVYQFGGIIDEGEEDRTGVEGGP